MQPEFTKLKVHNEIELCETADMDVKQKIERTLLANRISYYIKWRKQGIFCKTGISVSFASTTISRRKRSS